MNKLVLLGGILGFGGCCQLTATTKPNVVFILVDDLGYSDLNFIGQKKLQTPNIDRLAKEGIWFTNAYTAAPVSSPTRASLMTGLSPAELKLTCHIPGVGIQEYLSRINGKQRIGEAYFKDHLSEKETTLATVFKGQNYQTAFMGKWHLAGEGSQKTKNGIVNASWHPNNYGFDTNMGGCAYGQPSSYFSPYNNATISDGPAGEYLTDRLGDEAVSFIEGNNPQTTGNPFFLFMSFYTVHTPYQVPIDAVSQNDGNKYFAMIQKLDENVGKILRCLDNLNLTENTVVVFYSDNGGCHGNPPLSGRKGDLLEGGIRVPLIVRWPNVVTPNTISEEPVTSIDFYPTFAAIAGNKKAGVKDKSARSILPLLEGSKEVLKKRALYWHFPHRRHGTEWAMGAAIREGDWKLIYLYDSNEPKLFNLKTDLKEQHNLFSINPERGEYLLKKLNRWQKRVDAQMPERLSK